MMPPQIHDLHRHASTGSNSDDDESTTTATRTAEQHQQHLRRVTSSGDISVSSYDDGSRPKSARDYRMRKSSTIGMINWTHVLGVHAPMLMTVGLVLLVATVIHQVVSDLGITTQTHPINRDTVVQIVTAVHDLLLRWYQNTVDSSARSWRIFSPAVKCIFCILVAGWWLMQRQNPVYLMSFATFKAPENWKCSHADIMEIMRRQGCFTDDSLEFLKRILERSGTGQATAWPPGIVKCLPNRQVKMDSSSSNNTSDGSDADVNAEQDPVKADRSMEASRQEAATIIFDIVDNALRKAAVSPRNVDVLIINCSLFSPTPSLCAMVLSQFNMRSNVATYNLSGMGCSASLIAIDLAKQLLASSNRRMTALVVSTEILTPNFYHGNERGFLIQNTLFRCGGAAMVLSNSWMDGHRAWYKLLHTVRVQGTGEAAYQCVYETEDKDGRERGVRLSKDIVKVAGKCMEKNFTMLGPLILPWSEQAKVVAVIAIRWILKRLHKVLLAHKQDKWAASLPLVKPYVPDFKTCLDHFCIHAGGRAVIDGIEKNMQLEPFHTEPSRMTLLNFGNTSSSSIWYELEYIQEYQTSNPLKKGDRILQVAFGSGFKCTSGVWLKV